MKPDPINALRTIVILGSLAVVTVTPSALGADHHRSSRQAAVAASASITSVRVSSATVTVTGRVRLKHATAAQRRRSRVRLTLVAASGAKERRTTKIGAKGRYGASWTTRLSGRLTLRVQVIIAGKPRGKRIARTIDVTRPTQGTTLIGTFKLNPGAAPAGAQPTGSYFEMLQPNGSPLGNPSSSAPDQNYTPLAPGTDGGLRTDTFQPAPNPAFSGGSSGNALANRIIKPAPFFLIDFSTETASTDAQLSTPDPLPSITVSNGRLGGQITAWVAQWNGQSFNQGTPKPNGAIPPPTTPLTGTYEPATRAFTLEWKSLIVGGPFNGFTGRWHLAGTFVPNTTPTPGLPLPIPTL